MKHNFGVEISVDNRTGDLLAAYFKIRNGKSAETKEFGHGTAFADFDADGLLLGVEVLAPCHITVIEKITANEPQARRFVESSAPREMVLV